MKFTRDIPAEDGYYWVYDLSEVGTANQTHGYVERWLETHQLPSIMQIETENGVRVLYAMGYQVGESLNDQQRYLWSEKIEPPAMPAPENASRVALRNKLKIRTAS
jgi:hypothetical protein